MLKKHVIPPKHVGLVQKCISANFIEQNFQ